MQEVIAIVMAAGKGTRMKSKKSKLVHKIYGKEIIRRAVENVKKDKKCRHGNGYKAKLNQ